LINTLKANRGWNLNITINRVELIRKELNELNASLKMSVQRAITIGRLLSEQKEEMNHGEFLPWLESNFEMGEKTAYRYMGLFKHERKIVTMTNLQDAYNQIEQIEYQKKKQREQDDNKMIFEYKRTGKKPDGWERRHDALYKKFLDDAEFEKRKQAELDKKTTEKKRHEDDFKKSIEEDQRIIDFLEEKISQQKQNVELKEKLKLNNRNDNINQEVILETITDFIYCGNSIDDKIQRANNIIIYTRNLAVKLQQEKSGNK
jgi:hypothetical protein